MVDITEIAVNPEDRTAIKHLDLRKRSAQPRSAPGKKSSSPLEFLPHLCHLVLLRAPRSLLIFVFLAICLFSSGRQLFIGVELARADDITYTYDELGRLVGVVDQNGNAVTYTYDAVGNLLSITNGNSSSSPVSIVQFSPESGPVGTLVTISGLGFRPIAT